MSKFTAGKFSKSLSFALRGLRIAFKSQRNFRAQLGVAIIAFVLAFYLRFSVVEFCLVIIASSAVLVAELFNSVIEFVLDATYRNKYSKLVEMSKDMSAGAVLLVTFASITLGVVLYSSKLIPLVEAVYGK